MDSYIRSVYSAKISLIWKVAKEFFSKFTKRNLLLQTPVLKIAEEKLLIPLSLRLLRRKHERKRVGLWNEKERNKIESKFSAGKIYIFFSL